MESIFIGSEAMQVGVLPDYGARVTSLLDKQSGREWIAGGGQAAETDETATYGAEQAVGWDECFPTVGSWDASGTVWNRRLRDHGDLWGRKWSVQARSGSSLTTAFCAPEFDFTRTLTVNGPVLTANYRLDSNSSDPLPYLWAMHCLLAVSEADGIVLPGVTQLGATYLALGQTTLTAPNLCWPGGAPIPFPLNRVQPASRGFAGKFYASGIAARCAAVGHGRGWLWIGWDQSLDDLGIWLNYGAWPGPSNNHHIALEPTTAPAHHLGDALRARNAVSIAPGATIDWTITLTLAKDPP
jgi:hypothetical protein